MPPRRILSLWFPRLAAEQVLRAEPGLVGQPLAVVAEARGALVLASLAAAAEAEGLRRGMALGDARAISPELVTRPEDPWQEAAFLAALRRWAGKFSPWVAAEGTEGLMLDVTGSTHLFGGEVGMAAQIEAEAAELGLSLGIGLAETLGAAWAVARYAGAGSWQAHAGDAIDQEARATRSRAGKRSWAGEWQKAVPVVAAARVVPPGGTLAWIGPLPVAALRLERGEVETLQALGLRRIFDLVALPRAQLARRAGPGVLTRLDQALGRVAEPVAADRPPPVFAVRLTLPEPIGLEADVLAGIDRLLPALCSRLEAAGRGARRVRLTLVRTDGWPERREVGLARPACRPEAIRPLLELGLGEIDAGFGIERLRLEAVAVEPLAAAKETEATDFADLLGRLGTRLGVEAVVRLYPADSHIPERSAGEMTAVFSAPVKHWPTPAASRPILIFPPEPVAPEDDAVPPLAFVWRHRRRWRAAAFGPERIAPEWWFDDPAWRSGARDYWRVETEEGERLWLFAAQGGEMPGGWFAQGIFA